MDTRKKGIITTDTPYAPTKHEIMFDNPYHANDFELGNWFYRVDVLEPIRTRFESQPGNRFVNLRGSPGTGKTCILKYINSSPQQLKKEKPKPGHPGKNYIPIYLDARECIGLDSDNILSCLYDAVMEKLKESAHVIPVFDDTRERPAQGITIETILSDIDGYLEEDDVLVLMVDEFDTFLENADIKIISDYIKQAARIKKNWNHYGLILAGDKSLVNITTDKTIDQFLQTAFPIEIDGFLDEKAVKKRIIEPVRDQILYDNDAISKIIWYSGSHLYYQQLICYYIVSLLNEEERNHCSKEDVEKVIQRILIDSEGYKRPDFAYTWKNKMAVETRLLASALMDDSITEKIKNSYFLKENNLLKNIFAGKIDKEIYKSPGCIYFNPKQGKGFPGFPLKIPLLGLWVQKEHPFIKTVIENIESIADKIDMDDINAEIEAAPTDKLPTFGREVILELSQSWRLLEDSITVTPPTLVRTYIERFRQGLSTLLSLNIKEPASKGNYFILDIRNLNIGILDEAFCFIQDRPEITEKDIAGIENIATSVAQDTKTQLSLYFYFRKSIMVEDLEKKTYLNLIAIDTNDLKRIIFSNRPRETTRKIILSNLSLQKVSPYQTAGPATTTFYGRAKIIDHITRATNTSYSIIGARKIGKSSLLLRICDSPPPNTYYIFINMDQVFRGVTDYKPFLRNLQQKIEEIFNLKVNLVRFTTGRSLSRLHDVIRKLSLENKKIIFVFDEVDILVKFDRRREYRLLHTFRTMSQNDHCQFIFAGFKELYHRKREIENPLYNFCKEIILTPLDRKAALDLITRPMDSIGVQYQNTEDRELILEYTSCHPNLLQFFCEELIDKIEEHGKVEERRTIFRKDIEKLLDSKYENYIMDEIYMFFSDLPNINRLILVLLVEEYMEQPGPITFSLAKIRDKLIQQGLEISINKVHRNLRNLVMRFILADKGNENYCFALPVFPGILEKRIDDDFKNSLIDELKRR
jgi:Cdc6-like AAA superfamily ATPase